MPLESIKSESINGVNTYDFTNIFSDDYKVYLITLSGLDHNQSRQAINTRVIGSSGVKTGMNYKYANHVLRHDIDYQDDYSSGNNGWIRTLADGYGYGSGNFMYIFNPFDSSQHTYMTNQFSSYYDTTGGVYGAKSFGVYAVAESITGLNIYDNGSLTLYSGTISAYGVK